MTTPMAVRHVEVFYGIVSGDPIQLWCDCPIGQSHTYEQWVDRFQRPEQNRRRTSVLP